MVRSINKLLGDHILYLRYTEDSNTEDFVNGRYHFEASFVSCYVFYSGSPLKICYFWVLFYFVYNHFFFWE